MLRLEGISRKLSYEENRFLENLHTELWKELESVLIQEEVYWKQMSRCKWINYGDRNTTYFHNLATARKRRNKIHMLKDDHGAWVDDQGQLKDMGVQFFSQLYKDEGPAEKFIMSGFFPVLNDNELNSLSREVEEDEVHATVFSMGGWKASGPDGLPAMFSQSNWEHVKESVIDWIKKIFQNPEGIQPVNNTFLSLIPKKDKPESFAHFRPIGLCNVIYKVVTKMISRQLKYLMPKLIGPSQCSFVPGRQSSDNILVAQEVMHSMRFKTGEKGFMVIKVDLEKAYDRLNWQFIKDILVDVGLSENLVNTMMWCINSSNMQLLWNGATFQRFAPSRGIRQGVLCPRTFLSYALSASPN